MTDRTPAYWPTRILLAVGSIATVFTFALAVTLFVVEPAWFGPEPTVLGLPNGFVGRALAVAVALFGLVWMLRIFRGRASKHRSGVIATAEPDMWAAQPTVCAPPE